MQATAIPPILTVAGRTGHVSLEAQDITHAQSTTQRNQPDGYAGLNAHGHLSRHVATGIAFGAPVRQKVSVPAPTGTTHTPTTAAAIITAINSASDGDRVSLPVGTYDCTGTDLEPAAGVQIVGAGKDVTVLQGRLKLDAGGSSNVSWLADFTLNMSGQAEWKYAPCEFWSGTFRLLRFRATQADETDANAVTFVTSDSNPVDAICWDCEVDHADADCISTKDDDVAPGSPAGSKLTLVDCWAHHPGDGSADQMVTGHSGFEIYVYGGRYTDPGTYKLAAIPDASTNLYIYGAYLEGRVIGCVVEGCTVDGMGGVHGIQPQGISSDAWILRNYIHNVAGNVGTGIVMPVVSYSGQTIYVEGNILVGTGTDINGYKAGTGQDVSNGTHILANNTILSVRRGIDVRSTSADWDGAELYNNAININTGESGSYAIMKNSGDTDVAGYNTVTNESHFHYADTSGAIGNAPELDDDYMPILGGNCHQNGYASHSLQRDTDLAGFPMVADGHTIGRGARAVAFVPSGYED